MRWYGWGDEEHDVALPEPVLGLLRDLLGAEGTTPPVSADEISLPESRLPDGAQESLSAVVGAEHVQTGDAPRISHARGKSTPDLLRMRAGRADSAPDAVVLPRSHEEVLAVLAACAEHRVAVVPFGGGTSVTGGLTPVREAYEGVIALDLQRMNRVLGIDPLSRTAHMEAGLRAPEAEARLRADGFTLGHFPQSYEWASIGGFAATRSSGQASAGYGRFDDMVVALTVATPRGTLTLGRAPKSAAGPDMRQLMLGSEGVFGVITSVTMRIRPAPEVSSYEGWRFGAFSDGIAGLRTLAQDGPLPTVLRLSDETETIAGLAKPGELAGGFGTDTGCLVITGYEGTEHDVSHRRERVSGALRGAGAEPLGAAPGESWLKERFSGPYLRDALLNVGTMVETLETATFWSGLSGLYESVRSALTGQLPRSLVMCHVSHVYPAGASLYFTVCCAQGKDPLGRWEKAKLAANDAITAEGATITHHHGVGTDHRDWLSHEIGPLGVEVLRAVKNRLDPEGILNPGVLIR